jgi:N-acetylmuramoyl-L-alanine amidase
MLSFLETPSPNFNDRQAPLDMLVLHYTGMKDGPSALARLRDTAAGVSSHYVVEEDGTVFRLVPEEKRAFHAGKSRWQGDMDLNSRSIGIEIVNGGHDFGLPPFPDVQIEAVIELSRGILSRWPIPQSRVVGHSDIAPARKQDPGELFPWERLAEAGVGLWPSTSHYGPPSSDTDLEFLITETLWAIGYPVAPDAEWQPPTLEESIRAFQRRWTPAAITGAVDVQTLAAVEAVESLYVDYWSAMGGASKPTA